MPELNPLDFYLCVLRPVTVFSGVVNGTPSDPFISIDWTSGATGTASSIGTSGAPVAGNTVFFGTTTGGRERGIARLRSWTPSDGTGTAGTLVVGENDDVTPNVVNGDNITVKLFWQLWDRVPRQDATDPNHIIFYEDYNITFTDQTVNWRPIADAGPPGVAFLTAGQAQVSFVGDRSYALAQGASLSSYLWTAYGSSEGTSTSQGTEASPVTFTWTAAGQYLVSFQVTDSNGNTAINYTWVFIIDPASPTDVAYTNFDAISDNFDTFQGGGACNFTVHGTANTTTFPPESIVLHVARGTQTTATGTWPNRSNILYAGYITGDSIRQDPRHSTVSFRTVAIDGLMKKLAIYPVRLEDNQNPQNWTQAKDLTVDRVLSYLAHYRSTLGLMTSITALNDTSELKSQDFNASTLWGMFKALMADAWGFPVADHQSVLHLIRDYNNQTTAERAAATTRKTLHKGIWVGAIDTAERAEYEQPTRKVKWNGVYYPGDQAAAIPLFSEAPGDVMDSWGGEVSRSGFILSTQTDLNTRTGYEYARRNYQYPSVTMTFLNDGSFILAPQEIFPANIEAADNNRGFAWTPSLIPRSIRRTYNHQGGYFEVQVTFEPSVTGPAGATVDMPAEPPSATGGGVAPVNDPPPPPPAWTSPTVPVPGPAVGADTLDGCYITFDSGASWAARNNLLTVPQLAMQYLIWDPWWFTPSKHGTHDPEQVILLGCGLGFIVRSEDAGKAWQDETQNIDTPPNSWSDSPAPAVSDVTFIQVHGNIHANGQFIALGIISTALAERSWVLKTTDDWVTSSWQPDFRVASICPYTWSFEESGEGWTFTDENSTGTASADGSWNSTNEAWTLTMTPVGGTAWGTIYLENLAIDVEIGDTVQFDFSVPSPQANTSLLLKVIYDDESSYQATGDTNNAGTRTLTITVNGTIARIECWSGRQVGGGIYSQDIQEVRVDCGTSNPQPDTQGIGIDIDNQDGSIAWVTNWDSNDQLNVLQYSTATLLQTTSGIKLGAATKAQLNARTYIAWPFVVGLDNTVLFVFGRMNAPQGLANPEHLILTQDGGSTWSSVGDSATWGADYVGAFHADDTTTLYAFVNGSSRALYRSTDGGANWTSLSSLPFDVEPGGVSKHPDGRFLISNRDATPAMAAYSVAPDYSSWVDATGSPSFPTTGSGSKAIIWIV